MSGSSPVRKHASYSGRSARPADRTGRATWRSMLREVLVVVLGVVLYFGVRALMATQAALALTNAEALIALEQRLGLYHELWLQSLILDTAWRVDLANRVYIFGHWPVLITTLIWLLWRHRAHFPIYRSALLISGAIGLAVFVLLPMAPPRFLADQGFVDTVTLHSNAYRVLQPPSVTNQYAAMPSLHVGWNLLMGIAIVRHARPLLARTFGVGMPPALYLSTIVTANHYILDGVVGALVALAGLAIASRISRAQRPARTLGSDPGTAVPTPKPRRTRVPRQRGTLDAVRAARLADASGTAPGKRLGGDVSRRDDGSRTLLRRPPGAWPRSRRYDPRPSAAGRGPSPARARRPDPPPRR
jgi:hypothetical protein